MTTSKGGKPTVMTTETLAKLKTAFLEGLSDTQSCLQAGIGTTALYDYQKQHPEFKEEKEMWKSQTAMLARKVIHKAIEDKDLNTAKWYTEKRDKSFQPANKHELTGANGGPIQIIVNTNIK